MSKALLEALRAVSKMIENNEKNHTLNPEQPWLAQAIRLGILGKLSVAFSQVRWRRGPIDNSIELVTKTGDNPEIVASTTYENETSMDEAAATASQFILNRIKTIVYYYNSLGGGSIH